MSRRDSTLLTVGEAQRNLRFDELTTSVESRMGRGTFLIGGIIFLLVVLLLVM
jgi:hypothetical protein